MDGSEKLSFIDHVKEAFQSAWGLLRSFIRGDLSMEPGLVPLREEDFRRMGAYMMGGVMLVMLLLSMALNVAESAYSLLLPLALVCLVPLICFFLLWQKSDNADFVLLLLNGGLICLAAYLLLVNGSTYGASLLWFTAFPPVFMLSLGLKRGTLIFGIFFLFLSLVMVTPLNTFMAEQLPLGVRVRILLVMVGVFVFSWWSELLRSYMYSALRHAGRQLEKEAHTDPLTRLGNRRDCEKYFCVLKNSAIRESKPLSLLLIDLDYFKVINDSYGHEMGDKVLQHIAQSMALRTRPLERVFRWGGEEFIVLLPGVNRQEACLAAERLRRYVEETPYCDDGLVIPVTVSVGVYAGDGGDDLDQAFKVADRNLYEAKAAGRNKVVG